MFIKQNKFKIWSIDTIDDGIEVLTGLKAGTVDEEGSIHWLVNKTLSDFSETIKEFIDEDEIEEHPNAKPHWVSDMVMK